MQIASDAVVHGVGGNVVTAYGPAQMALQGRRLGVPRAAAGSRTLPLLPIRLCHHHWQYSLTRPGAGVALGWVQRAASRRPRAGGSGVRGRLRAWGTRPTLPMQSRRLC